MGRYTFPAFQKAPPYVVICGPALACTRCQRLEPAADLIGGMAAGIERFEDEG
jgi:hypothetical protein